MKQGNMVCLPSGILQCVFPEKRSRRLLACLCLLPVFLFGFSASAWAQAGRAGRLTENIDSVVPFRSRVAFKTNVVDWVLLLPNASLEFDLSRSPYKHWTLNLSAKSNAFIPRSEYANHAYELTSFRGEFRKYNRTSYKNSGSEYGKKSFGDWLRDDVFTWKRNNPRYWRAYYFGGYVDYTDFDLKFSSEGYRGRALGAGVSFGFGIPVYAYRRGALDMEFGGSVGAVYAEYDTYRHDKSSGQFVTTRSGISKVLPYPVVSELRVSLVYRFVSIKNKYVLFNREPKMSLREKRRLRKAAEQQSAE